MKNHPHKNVMCMNSFTNILKVGYKRGIRDNRHGAAGGERLKSKTQPHKFLKASVYTPIYPMHLNFSSVAYLFSLTVFSLF